MLAGLWLRFQVAGCMKLVGRELAYENSHLSLLLIAWDVLRGGTSRTQRQTFHTDEEYISQYCLFSYRFIARHISKAKQWMMVYNSVARTQGAYNVT